MSVCSREDTGPLACDGMNCPSQAAGMVCGDVYVPRSEGTPQGGPLSPLLANLLLDELDRELEMRGHRFVRYADDCNIYVGSRRAGGRVMRSISEFLTDRLKLKVNEAKSAVGKPYERAFLGFSIVRGGKIAVSAKARDKLKAKVRELSSWMMRKLRCYLWKQWGSRGYRELRKRGVGRDLAWNTSKSAHGPWRISMSPALSIALPTRHFVEMGLPLLHT